jgi:hypothetical protein
MMTNIPYMKDTTKFWQAREKARATLDKQRANSSHTKKVKTAQKLHSDAVFLKSGRVISSKR